MKKITPKAPDHTINDQNEPVFNLPVDLSVERTDHTMRLRQSVASGKSNAGQKFEVCLAGIEMTVEIKEENHTDIYAIDLRPIIQKVLDQHTGFALVPRLPRVDKKKGA